MRCGLVESWRYYQGRFSTLRIERLLRDRPSIRPDTNKADPMDTLAATDVLTEPETGEPGAGEAPNEDERH